MTDQRNRSRKTRDEILVQGLYFGDGWVTVYDAPSDEAAASCLRILRTKNPAVAYRVERKRVSVQQVQP